MHAGMIDRQAIRRRWEAVGSKLDERGRRMFAAGEALVAGFGGLEAVSAISSSKSSGHRLIFGIPKLLEK